MYVGIDIGGTNIAIGLVKENKLICKESIKTRKGITDRELVGEVFEEIKKLFGNKKVDISELKAVGIGAPGAVDTKNGITGRLVNISNAEFNFRKEFSYLTDAKIYVDNDANCAAIGEAVAGAGRNCDNMVMVTLGTGVGAGIIIGNRLYGGFNGAAGEIGHMIIVCGGEKCNCGNRGCYEQYASVSALIRMTKEAILKHPESEMFKDNEVTGMTAFKAAKKGDKAALEVVDKYETYISVGLINVINIMQPDIVVIGGGISKEGEYLLRPVRERVYSGIFTRNIKSAEIKPAELGNNAGIIGAALLYKYQEQ